MKDHDRNSSQTGSSRRSRWNDLGALGLIALLDVVTVLAAACGGDSAASPADQAMQQGKAHFTRICATCHGSDARGLPRLGKSLRDNEFTQSQSDAELVAFLKVGRSAGDPLNETGVDMPTKGGDPTLTEDDLKNIVAFLRTL